MNRLEASEKALEIGVPRTRGDEPIADDKAYDDGVRSPHRRG